MHDIIIVGGGPAGLTAAVYGLRAGKSVLVIEKGGFGGQIAFSPKVENIPGTKLISGTEFADQLTDQAMALGADVELEGRKAIIRGIDRFRGTEVTATDLRAGAAMILAALAAEGETIIDGVRYIDRGYELVEDKFNAMGADIVRYKGE